MAATDKKKILAIMRKCASHAYLATCDGDQPRMRSVTPIVEDDLAMWIATFGDSRKVRQIKKNPKVCLAFIEQPSGDRAVKVYGKAVLVKDLAEKKRIWRMAGFDLSQYFPGGPKDKNYCLLRIDAEEMEWRESWEKGNEIYKNK